MQFFPITALLNLFPSAAVINDRSLAVAEVEERVLLKPPILSTLDIFTGSGCINYQDTIFTTGSPVNFNGECYEFDPPVLSVKTTFLPGSCTLTVYNDSHCRFGGTSAWADGKCVSGSWKSFSTDSCVPP